ncbi:CD48 antigen [Oryzias melastigma]|uniref:CD48 antigen n=1 Tax=Oryzias melastigma TaxID=30732 RepID=A0A834C4Y4_ORYME|nr:CD48 antigen [Oryzias melastigma]
MSSTPSVVLFLAWITTDVHSEKILDRLRDSTVVLSPDHVEDPITIITWRYKTHLAADWNGQKAPFSRIFKDGCSLNTETGELTINSVRLEDGGVYTPQINNKTQTAVKLQVFSPVPKPNITLSCNPEETQCTLSCTFNRTDDLGEVQIFWILDDKLKKEGKELNITKETKELMFICSLENSVSSGNSSELQNPLFFKNEDVIYLVFFALYAFLLFVVGLIIIHQKEELQPLNDSNRLEPAENPDPALSSDTNLIRIQDHLIHLAEADPDEGSSGSSD